MGGIGMKAGGRKGWELDIDVGADLIEVGRYSVIDRVRLSVKFKLFFACCDYVGTVAIDVSEAEEGISRR